MRSKRLFEKSLLIGDRLDVKGALRSKVDTWHVQFVVKDGPCIWFTEKKLAVGRSSDQSFDL